MMNRRRFLASLSMLATIPLSSQTSHGASLDAKTIRAGLETATPEENGFIEYVVARVEAGTLPLALVESTFQWARQKPKQKFQYFKRALIQRAAKIGIKL